MSVQKAPSAGLVPEWQASVDSSDEPGETSGIRNRDGAASPAVGALDRGRFLTLAEKTFNPRAAEIERESAEIARQVGLLHTGNQRRFTAFNSIIGHVYPRASVERAVVCSLWCNWLFFFDDVHDEDVSVCDDLDRVNRQMETYLGLLLGVVTSPTPTPLERLTTSFRTRAVEIMGQPWLKRFCGLVEDYFFRGVLPAVRNWRAGTVPPLAEYLEQRIHDSAVLTTVDLIEIAEEVHISDEVRSSPDVQQARFACAKAVACFNDIVSYPKEVLHHKNPNNLIHLLVNERGLSVPEALASATEIANDASYELFSAAHRILSQLPPGPHPLRSYLEAMKIWQRGNIEYSLEAGRYDSRFSPLAELVNPKARY